MTTPAHPLTESELALLAYFHTVSGDPRVRAAGYDVLKGSQALLSCVQDNAAVVVAFAFRGVVERVKPIAAGVARTVVSRALEREGLPSVVRASAEAAVSAGVEEGVRLLGDVADRLFGDAQAKSRASRKARR